MPDGGREAPGRLFIIVRRDLPCGQRPVQSCHALAELMRKHFDEPSVREWADRHKTLVILGVRDRRELLRWRRRLGDARVTCEAFSEPDMNGEETALAVHPAADPHHFRNLRLL